jgi:hypothetical protein
MRRERRSAPVRRRVPGASTLMVVLGAAVLAAGCGGGDDSAAALSAEQVASFSSPYCVTARKWAVHELNGGGDGAYAREGPDGFKTWWKEQLAALKLSVAQAPAVIRDAEAVNEKAIRTRLTPLVEKYGFDFERIAAEATPAETAFADHPPASVANAQQARNEYQNRVCGYGGSPPPARVAFEKSAASKAYCEAAAAQQTGIGTVAEAGVTAAAFRAYATSDQFLDALDAQDATAPPEIADDVKTDNEWVREHKLTLLEKYDYDYRRLVLEGSAEELSAFNYFDPRVEEHDSRVSAYAQQVCGIE